MNYELIIIRYGEIALKGKETRKYFENCLISNIKTVLILKNISAIIKKERGRIYLYTDYIKESIDVLKRIFGIISISPANTMSWRKYACVGMFVAIKISQ